MLNFVEGYLNSKGLNCFSVSAEVETGLLQLTSMNVDIDDHFSAFTPALILPEPDFERCKNSNIILFALRDFESNTDRAEVFLKANNDFGFVISNNSGDAICMTDKLVMVFYDAGYPGDMFYVNQLFASRYEE